MADVKEYKCPNCGGALNFDSSLQKVKCPFCDTEFEMDILKQYDEDLQNDAKDEMEWSVPSSEWGSEDAGKMRVYSCKSCGGEIVGDENMAAAACPYCDNPIVLSGQLSGDLKPDYVIPFKLDKKAAINEFSKHLTGKRLLNKAFSDSHHIEEVKGIYVPYWLFNTGTSARLRYKANKVKTWEDNKYKYEETSYFSVYRDCDVAFEHVPVDGSSKMADDLMESLEPYNYKDAVPFQTAYLAGYLADKYDVDSKSSIVRANERIKKSTYDEVEKTITGYNSFELQGGNVKFSDAKVEYALYPVWLLNTTWEGKKYTFAMNGQTGKFVGDLPLDKAAYRSWLFKLTAILTVVFFGISSIMYLL